MKSLTGYRPGNLARKGKTEMDLLTVTKQELESKRRAKRAIEMGNYDEAINHIQDLKILREMNLNDKRKS